MHIFGSVCEEGNYFKNLTFCPSIFIDFFFLSIVSIFIADIPITTLLLGDIARGDIASV